jgi:hypothetical protein
VEPPEIVAFCTAAPLKTAKTGVFDVFTLQNAIFPDGNVTLRGGNVTFRSGNVTFRSGNVTFRSGNVAFRDGNGAFPSGNGAFRSGNGTFPSGNGALREDNATFPAGNTALRGADGASGGAGGRRSEAGRASAPANGTPAFPENSPAIHGWVKHSTNDPSPGWDERKCAEVSAVPAGTRFLFARRNPELKLWAIFRKPNGIPSFSPRLYAGRYVISAGGGTGKLPPRRGWRPCAGVSTTMSRLRRCSLSSC